MFEYYNANAVNRNTDDCVIRAISCATNKSWDYVYDYLSDLAQYEGTLFDKKDFVINYLDKKYKRLQGVYGKVGDVVLMYPNSVLLISTNSHLLCSKMGIIYDTFDPRNQDVEYVWLVK